MKLQIHKRRHPGTQQTLVTLQPEKESTHPELATWVRRVEHNAAQAPQDRLRGSCAYWVHRLGRDFQQSSEKNLWKEP